MADILLYGGLGIILIAILLALAAAIIGCKIQGWKFPDIMLPRRFIGPTLKLPSSMKRLLRLSVVVFVIGSIVLGAGFWIALK